MTKVLDTITQHKFGTLGVKTITVTPSFNGCKGLPASFQINVTTSRILMIDGPVFTEVD